MNKNTFIFNLEWYTVLLEYPAEVRFEVYEAIMEYASSGKLPELKPLAKMAFSFIKKEMDYNQERYDTIIEKRREAGRRGANAKKAEREKASEANAHEAIENEQTQHKEANQANANFANVDKQNEQKPANVANAESAKQTQHKEANQADNVNDNDIIINDNIFLLRVREDVPEIKKAYLDQFFGNDKQITLDRTLKNWETTREELMKVCEEVLCDWTHENIQHKTAEEAQRYFYNAVRFKFSKIKEKQNEKNGSKTQRSSGKRSSGQARNALDASPQPGFGLVN